MKLYSYPQVSQVRLTDGVFAPRLETNRTRTIPASLAKCKETGRLKAFDLKWKPGMPDRPHQFWDSDVAKVVEGMAIQLQNQPDKKLESSLNKLAERIVSAQQPDGYLNTYFTQVEPEKRWTNLHAMHELYCAGHLMEAAVEHFRATGRRNFLDAMCRYADYIAKVFGRGKGQKRGYPGHEEIELALCKLAEASGNPKYLKLAKYFVDERGQTPNYFVRQEQETERGLVSLQAHRPVREQTEAVGHAVRAGYLYSGMADVAAASGDKELLAVCEKLFDSIAEKRMYLTGGIGSRREAEAFGNDYELPNTAYAESCAAISLVFFASRMLNITGQAKYAEVVERAMYNGTLSGISLDGEKFFYKNMLEANELTPYETERVPWFDCSCCPTNFCRYLAQQGRYLWSLGDDAVRLNIPAASTLTDGNRQIRVTGGYPYDGKISIEFLAGGTYAFSVRIPAWCGKWSARKNGKKIAGKAAAGFLVCGRSWKKGDRIELELEMPVRVIYANRKLHEDAGRIALMRGPVVYAFESVENGSCLSDVLIPADPTAYTLIRAHGLPAGTVAIRASGLRESRAENAALYGELPPKTRKCTVTAVPFALWQNRGKAEMQVWMRRMMDCK